MKFIIGILATVLVSAALAQSQIKADVFYDFAHHRSMAVVSKPLGQLTNLFGKPGWNVNTSTFVGADGFGVVTAGYAATTSFKVADQISIYAGPAGIFTQGERPRLGVLLGFSFRQ